MHSIFQCEARLIRIYDVFLKGRRKLVSTSTENQIIRLRNSAMKFIYQNDIGCMCLRSNLITISSGLKGCEDTFCNVSRLELILQVLENVTHNPL